MPQYKQESALVLVSREHPKFVMDPKELMFARYFFHCCMAENRLGVQVQPFVMCTLCPNTVRHQTSVTVSEDKPTFQ